MRKYLLLSLLLPLVSNINAQNRLVVFNQEGKQFYIILNGVRQNVQPQTNVKIDELTSDAYKLKIIFADGVTADVDKSIYFSDPNHEIVSEVRKNNKGVHKLRMISYGPTVSNNYQAASTIHYTNTEAVNTSNNNQINNAGNPNQTVTTHHNSSTATMHTNVNNGNGSNENINMNLNMGGVGMNVNVNMNENGNNLNQNAIITETYSSSTTITTNNTHTQGNHNHSNHNHVNQNHHYGCYTSTVDYNSLLNAIEGESFADDKKMVTKQALANKCISAEQVVGLMEKFSFEDDKMEIAKYCYERCSDPDNYYKVTSAFTFSSSKEELNKYIESKK